MFEEFEGSGALKVDGGQPDGFKLTDKNYYSVEANEHYMSVSQYKNFAGCHGILGCEAAAMAKLRGEWVEEPNKAMMIGSYIDSYFEGTLDAFKTSHPEMFKRDGELKADFVKAEEMIARAEKDELFKTYMSGDKQVIMTGEICGVPWKIKMDSYIEGQAIVDLKCMASLTEVKWTKDQGYLPFPLYWGYDIQGAVYQEIVRQNTGLTLPFFIAGISKEEEPDINVIWMPDVYLKEALGGVKKNMPRIISLLRGEAQAARCECCAYCRRTKILAKPTHLADMIPSI